MEIEKIAATYPGDSTWLLEMKEARNKADKKGYIYALKVFNQQQPCGAGGVSYGKRLQKSRWGDFSL